MTSQFFCKSHVAYFHFKIYLILPLIEIHVNMKVSLHFLPSRAPLISFKVFHLSSSYWSSLPFFPCNLYHISYLSLGELCLLLVEHLFLKEQAPKESSAAKLKIGPIIKLCFFSSFEKLFGVTGFWEVGNKSTASVDIVVDQVWSEDNLCFFAQG